MGALTKLQLLTKHLQYTGLLRSIDIPWPSNFIHFISFSNICNLNFNYVYELVDGLPRINFRLMFIGVATLFPLVLMIFTLLVFVTLYTILWACMGLIGAIMVGARIVNKLLPDVIPQDFVAPISTDTFLGIGIAMLVIFVLARLANHLEYRLCFRRGPRLLRELVAPGGVFCGAILSQLSQVVLLVLCGVIVLHFLHMVWTDFRRRFTQIFGTVVVLAGAAAYYFKGQFKYEGCIPQQLNVPGIVIIVLGLLQFLQDLLYSKTSSGVGKFFANTREKLQRLLDTGLLTLAFFAFGMIFVPVVTFAFQMYVCTDYNCAALSKFNPFAPRPEDTYSTDESIFCDQCLFDLADCTLDPRVLCPAFHSRRLISHPDTPCDDKGHKFFVISSCLVLVVFVLFLNLMYRTIIRQLTDRLEVRAKDVFRKKCADAKVEEKPTDEKKKKPSENGAESGILAVPLLDGAVTVNYDEVLDDTFNMCEPKASSLYQPYKLKHRFFMLIDTLHRLMLVMCSVIVAPYSDAAAGLCLVLHLGMLCLLSYFQPYGENFELILSIVLSACDTLNAVYAVLVWRTEWAILASDGVLILLVFTNVVIPFVLAIVLQIMAIHSYFNSPRMKAAREKKRELRKKAEEREKREKEKKLAKQRLNKAKKELVSVFGESINDEQELKSDEEDDDADDAALTREQRKKKDEKKDKEEKTPEEQLTDQLNAETKQIVLKYFAFFSVPILVAAACLTFFATLNAEQDEFVDGSSSLQRGKEYVLGGEASWPNFTAHCCCLETENPMDGYNITERWVCAQPINENVTLPVPLSRNSSYYHDKYKSGLTVSRNRLTEDRRHSGIPGY